MNSASLERWQVERLLSRVRQEHHYLDRFEGRMHQKHFPVNDPVSLMRGAHEHDRARL